MKILMAIVFCLTIYFLPTGIALLLNKRAKLSLFVLNLAIGWTTIGWIFALFMVLRAQRDYEKDRVYVKTGFSTFMASLLLTGSA